MILGKITGKLSTMEFSFLVDTEAKKFEYLQVYHKNYGYVLCQVVELIKDIDKEIAKCSVIGYKDKSGGVKSVRTPFEVGTEVLLAEDKFISEILKLEKEKEGAFIGRLEGRKIDIFLDMNKLLTKHVSILAKTGAGKSYVAGVLVEEIMDKGVPLLIIDPHGEYSMLKYENDSEEDSKKMEKFGIKKKGYVKRIKEYGDIDINEDLKPLVLNDEFTSQDIIKIMPSKMTGSQEALVYASMKELNKITLTRLMEKIQDSDSQQKWNLLNVFEYLKNMNLFSENFIPYNELIYPKRCSIVNLKGIEPEVQEIIVFKLLKDLFEQRKKGKIPPFFCLLEEAHNFIPERSFGEKKCSGIIRTIASEGRKFGMGLCVISQRPARIEKNVLSQCNTQIILKITNPGDLKAITSSVEGIIEGGDEEIKNLPIGSAMVTGVVDVPLFVNIRPRKSKHGGDAVEIFGKEEEVDVDVDKEIKKFQKKKLLPIINSKFSKKELRIIHGDKVTISTYLIPAMLASVGVEKKFNLLIELVKGNIVKDMNKNKTATIKDVQIFEDFKIFDKIEYINVDYDKKIKANISESDLKKKLERIIKVNNMSECFIVYYHIGK